MSGFVDIFRQYANGEVPIPDQKKQQVEQAANAKKLQMGAPSPDEMYRIAAARDNETGANIPGEAAQDVLRSTPEQLYNKYGSAASSLIAGYANGAAEYSSDRRAAVTPGQAAGDIALGAGSGFVQGVLGIPALAAGAVSDTAGAWSAEKLDGISSWFQEKQSAGLNSRRKANQVINELDYADSKAVSDSEGGGLLSSLRRIGRDAYSAVSNAADDPTVLGDGMANAAGSLLVGGPLTKGIKIAGTKAVNSLLRRGVIADGAALTAKLDRAATPLAIGATEAGGTYTQTVNEVMSMDHDQLMEGSPEYAQMIQSGMGSEEAKQSIANNAGLIAASIQFPAAMATGTLVSKFEANPFRVGSASRALSNMGKEALEESVQSASSQLATNTGLLGANKDQDMLAGVGEQVGLGALYGAGSAGVVSAPGVPIDLAKRGFGKASAAVLNRYEGFKRSNQESAPTADPAIRQAFEESTTAAPVVMEELRTAIQESDAAPEVKAQDEQYLTDLDNIARFDPTPYQDADPVIRETLGSVDNKFDAMQSLSNAVTDTTRNGDDRMTASLALYGLITEHGDALVGQFSKSLEAIPDDHPMLPKLREYEDILGNIQNSQTIRAALSMAQKMIVERADTLPDTVDEATITKPEGQRIVQEAIGIADLAPEKMNPDVADQILKHANDGLIQLAPQQVASLQAAAELVRTARDATQWSKDLGIRETDVVSDEITAGERKEGRPASALAQMKEITRAARVGQNDEAKILAQNLLDFAQHMQNKLDAINKTVRKGEAKRIPFKARNHRTGEWFTDQSPIIYYNRPGSIQLAQRIAVEAQAVGRVANNMAAVFPGLGIKPIKLTEVDDILNQPVDAVMDFFKPKSVVEAAVAEPVIEEPAPEVVETKETEPVVESVVEAQEEETPTNEPEIQEVEPETPTVAEEVTPKPEVVETPVAAEKPALSSTERVYPNLTGSQFTNAFKMPPIERTRLIGTDASPVELISDVLGSPNRFNSFVGDITYKYTPEIARAYSEFMENADSVISTMEKNLQDYLKGPYKGYKNRLDAYQNGVALDRQYAGRALAITETDADGNIQYNPKLMGAAVLAGMQFIAAADQYVTDYKAEDAARILGINEEDVTDDILNQFNQSGAGIVEVKSAITGLIKKFWGVSANDSVSQGTTEGIPEAVAAEVMRALIDNDALSESNLEFTDLETPKSFKILSPIKLSADNPMKAFPTAIEYAVMVEPEDQTFIGTPPKVIPKSQLRNSLAPLTDEQKAAVKNEQDTPHYLDSTMVKLYTGLGVEGGVALFGSRTEGLALNPNHKQSLEGQNRTISAAMEHLMGVIAQVRNKADVAGVSEDQMPIHYAYEFSRVNRMQMQGLHNPQANKLVREAILPTRSTLDLSNQGTEDFTKFALGLAQALGVKVEKLTREASVDQVLKDLQSKYTQSLSILGSQLNAGAALGLSLDDIETIRIEFGGAPSVVGFHALVEYARYQQANDRSAFTTSLYVEADGVTNGPINAMVILTSGAFTPEWLRNMAKGGLFPSQYKTLADQRAADPVDLYETTTNSLSTRLNQMLNNGSNDPLTREQLSAVLSLMNQFLPDLQVEDDGSLTIKRGIAKNPLTVTIYGSGNRGIAAKITKALVDAMYERYSEALQKMEADKVSFGEAMFSSPEEYESYRQNLNQLLNYQLRQGKDGPYLFETKKTRKKPSNRTGFDKGMGTFDAIDFQALQNNVLNTFVDPLAESIKDTLAGNMLDNAGLIRTATQVQSIFGEYEFQRLVGDKLAEKEKDPDFGKTDFLSKKELDDIRKDILTRNPIVQTGTQNLYIAGSDSTNVTNKEFGRGLNGSFRTDAFIYGPKNSGVSGIPYSVISMGDGQMMQTLATMPGKPEGTLKVFDGMHMRLSDIYTDSQKANEAAYSVWINSNPLKSIAKSYAKFASNVNFENISKEQHRALAKALFGLQETEETKSLNEIKAEVANYTNYLQAEADSVSRRQEVLKSFKLTIDQMASVGSPYVTEGDEITETDPEKIAKILNDRMNGTSEAQPEQAVKLGRIDTKSGARILSTNSLRQVARDATVPVEQRALLNDIVRTMVAKEYTVVLGSPEQVAAYAENSDKRVIQYNSKMQGATHIGDKTIYLYNPSSETLVHELIHAATYETVADYYNGKITSVEQVKAIGRIEELQKQFLSLDPGEMDADTRKAFDDAKREIMLQQNNVSIPVALSKANALNEFMAWALTNEQLVKLGKKTNVLSRLSQAVIDGIKRLIWGRKVAPKAEADLFSNLKFNTEILFHKQPSALEIYQDSVLYQNIENERLAKLDNILINKIVKYLGDPLTISGSKARLEHSRALQLAGDVAITLRGKGFPMSLQEETVFNTLVSVMATAIQLDGNALARAQEIYSHVEKNLKVEDFMVDLDGDEQQKRSIAQNRFDAVLGVGVSQKDSLGRSSLLSTFLALAQTNEDFRKVLSHMDLPKVDLGAANTFDQALENFGTRTMDGLNRLMSGEKRNESNVRQILDALTDRITQTAEERKSYIDNFMAPGGTLVDKMNDKVLGAMTALSDAGIRKGDELAESNNKYAKVLGQLMSSVSGMLSEENGAKVAEDLMSSANRTNMPQFLHDMLNELVGRTKSNAQIYDMIKMVRSMVAQMRQQFREFLPKTIEKKFSRKLTDQEWGMLFKGMAKTDLASLTDIGKMSLKDVIELVTDKSKLDTAITSFENTINKLDSRHKSLLLKKSEDLAQYMVNGMVPSNLLRNAYAIASLFGEATANGRPVPTKDLIDAVNQLVSLYALRDTDQATKDTLASLAQTEEEGLSFTLAQLMSLRREENRKAKMNGAAINHYKGYIPSIPEGGATLIVADDTEFTKLAEKSFKRIGNYGGSSVERNSGTKGYYYASVGDRAMYNQGLFQNVRQTAAGVDLATGFSQGMIAGRITSPAKIKTMETQIATGKETGIEKLMPVYDASGKVIAYERPMDPARVAMLEHNDHLAKMIGVWKGRQAEELVAGEYNKTLVDRLYDMWNQDSKIPGKQVDYIDLFDKKALKTYALSDAMRLMTDENKAYAESLFGDRFMVRKDMLNDALGYRQLSVREAWENDDPMNRHSDLANAGLNRIRKMAQTAFGNEAFRYMVNAEKFVQSAVTDAKVLIVIKSVVVPITNLMANFYQLAGRGVPMANMVRSFPKKTAEVDSYMRSRLRLLEAEAELNAVEEDPVKARKLRAEIQSINDIHRRLSIWPLIEAGEFSAISDATITHEDITLTSGKLNQYIEKLVDKLPEQVKTAGRYAYITRDTALFRGLQKAIEYGDFLGKSILYDDLTVRKGLSKEDALARITEEFVNYDRLPGRMRGYLESVGLLWFWNFKVRSTKVALSMIRNNPVHVLLTTLAPTPSLFGSVGMPTGDNIFTLTMEGKLDTSIGMGQGFRAMNLNPWVNIVS